MRRSWDSKHHLSNSKLVLSATTFTHPPLLSPGNHHSPTMSCTSCFHFAALGMEDLYLHCELRKVYPLFKAQLHGPLPITFPTSPASLIVSISFLWPLYNDIKPSIHPSDQTRFPSFLFNTACTCNYNHCLSWSFSGNVHP